MRRWWTMYACVGGGRSYAHMCKVGGAVHACVGWAELGRSYARMCRVVNGHVMLCMYVISLYSSSVWFSELKT